MVASPPGEIRVTGGTLPPAHTIALMMCPSVAVNWNWTGGNPVTAAVTTTGPADAPSVTETPAIPSAAVCTLAALSVADPEATEKVTVTPGMTAPPWPET